MSGAAFEIVDQINELAVALREANDAMRGKLYQLAARIMRELGHPAIADEIEQCLYNEARKKAKSSGHTC